MKISLCLLFTMLALSAVAQSNPVPLVNNPLVPSSALPGGTAFTLTVNGTGFVTGSTVDWNGAPLQTTFVSGSQLTATVPAAKIATAGTASVTVASPAPGGGTSNVAWFTVREPFPAAGFDYSSYPAGTEPAFPVVADFNNDGNLDVAVLDFEDFAVGVLLGNGDTTFQAVKQYSVASGPGPSALIAGDFNHDGNMDLIVHNFFGMVSVLLGNGDGTFQTQKDSPSVAFAYSMVAGDFNGDGKLDVAISVDSPTGEAAVMLGNGDGTFQEPVTYTAGTSAKGVAAGDFNRDGKVDLAVVGFSGTTAIATILLGNGDGTFQIASSFGTGSGASDVIAADFNGDGILDLAVKTESLSLLLGNGDGSFQTPITSAFSNFMFLAAADVNGDSRLDLVSPQGSMALLSLGTGNGTFLAPAYFAAAKAPTGVTMGDFNGDGLIDIVVADDNNAVAVLPQITSAISPTLLGFGSVRLGKSKTRQSTLMNFGKSVLRIDRVGLQGDDSSVFSETNTCGSGVQPGKSCKIAITFTPQAPHIYTQARVAIRDSATRLSQKIMLEGMGLK